MAYSRTMALALGSSQTGLEATLRAALVEAGGTIHASLRDIATGFIESGAGNYHWYYAAFPDAFLGSVVFYVGTLGADTDFDGVTVKAQANGRRNYDPTLHEVDGLTMDVINKILFAAVTGTTELEDDNIIHFKDRSGNIVLSVTYGEDRGVREISDIP